jgi:hypothetical protein
MPESKARDTRLWPFSSDEPECFTHVDYSSLGSLAPGLISSFNNSTGEFSIITAVPEPSRALLRRLRTSWHSFDRTTLPKMI